MRVWKIICATCQKGYISPIKFSRKAPENAPNGVLRRILKWTAAKGLIFPSTTKHLLTSSVYRCHYLSLAVLLLCLIRYKGAHRSKRSVYRNGRPWMWHTFIIFLLHFISVQKNIQQILSHVSSCNIRSYLMYLKLFAIFCSGVQCKIIKCVPFKNLLVLRQNYSCWIIGEVHLLFSAV